MMRSRPRANSSSSDGSLAKGNRVLIVATENTLQRVPQYIGQVGIVKEAPVHPCTWFKIKFDDGEVFTFRPSALVGVDADYNPESGVIPKSKYHSPEQIKEGKTISGGGTPLRTPPKMLSDLDGDLWVGAVVRITTGRMSNHEGTVLRSGNGWVQVETSTFGEVAKRAHELELVSYDTSRASSSVPRVYHTTPPSHMSAKRSYDSAMGEDVIRTASGRHVRPRAYSDAASDDGKHASRGNGGRTHSYDANGNLLTTPSEMKPPSAPLIHPNIKEARNQYMQKYVKKMTEKLKNRPDLMYWTHMLKASHVLSGGQPDHALEAELARDFNDCFCKTCLRERWPAAKYCWNEACPSSPVYYKLTGCPLPGQGSPEATGDNCSKPQPSDEHKSDHNSDKALDDSAEHENSMITISDDAVPGDARFNALEHARIIRVRRHQVPPAESAVIDSMHNLPTVLLSGAENGESKVGNDGMILVETRNKSFKIPNSATGRALLAEKVVREGLADSTDRVCGDNWSVPLDEAMRKQKEAMGVSNNLENKHLQRVQSGSSIRSTPSPLMGEMRNSDGKVKSMLPPYVTGVPSVMGINDYLKSQQDRPAHHQSQPPQGLQLGNLQPRLPSLLGNGHSEYHKPTPSSMYTLPDSISGRTLPMDSSAIQTTLMLAGNKASPRDASDNGGLFLSGHVQGSNPSRISPYLARGPEAFSYGSAGGTSTDMGGKPPVS